MRPEIRHELPRSTLDRQAVAGSVEKPEIPANLPDRRHRAKIVPISDH